MTLVARCVADQAVEVLASVGRALVGITRSEIMVERDADEAAVRSAVAEPDYTVEKRLPSAT